jgi:tetratricopeptide (TPR) repeat protein
MQRLTLSFLMLLFSFFSFSQEEDESCANPPKKVMKLIEIAKNATDPQLAVTKFNEAIDLAPENSLAYYEFGMYAFNQGLKLYEKFPNPAQGDKSFLKAEQLFAQALGYCNDFHANCFYYLGVINYSQKEMDEAIKHFKSFVAFTHKDVNRYSEEHDKKKNQMQKKS